MFKRDAKPPSPGAALKALRTDRGWTQKTLSELTGIAETNLSNIERGRTRLGEDRASLLAEALGVHPALLLFPEGYERPDLVPRLRKIRNKLEKLKRDTGLIIAERNPLSDR